jgi:hypothetical protein
MRDFSMKTGLRGFISRQRPEAEGLEREAQCLPCSLGLAAEKGGTPYLLLA